MKKYVCSVCGYVHEGDAAPANCPVCKVPAEKFKEMVEGAALAAEHEYKKRAILRNLLAQRHLLCMLQRKMEKLLEMRVITECQERE